MSARPFLKFFPSDWRADPALGMCSIAARGLWMEMVCLMHEADPYGHLLVKGRAPTTKQFASLVRSTPEEVEPLLAELLEAEVYSVTTDGVIFSRRMIRDAERSQRAKVNGSTGGNPALMAKRPEQVKQDVIQEDKGNPNGQVKPSRARNHIPYSRSQKDLGSPEDKSSYEPCPIAPQSAASDGPPVNGLNGHGVRDYPSAFEQLWAEFPKSPNASKLKAFTAWKKLSKPDRTACLIGAGEYAAWLDKETAKRSRSGHDPPPAKHLATFVNGRGWEPFIEAEHEERTWPPLTS